MFKPFEKAKSSYLIHTKSMGNDEYLCKYNFLQKVFSNGNLKCLLNKYWSVLYQVKVLVLIFHHSLPKMNIDSQLPVQMFL